MAPPRRAKSLPTDDLGTIWDQAQPGITGDLAGVGIAGASIIGIGSVTGEGSGSR